MAKKTKKAVEDVKNQDAPPAPTGPADMKVERVAIASLKFDPRNARLHNEKNMASIVASLREYSQQKPIVVDKDGKVLAGNGTLQGAIALGWTEIYVVRSTLAELRAKGYAIADNRSGELSEWDFDELNRQVQELSDAGFDDDLIAFSDKELDALREGDFDEAHAFAPKREKPEQEAEQVEIVPQFKVIITCKTEQKQAEVIRLCEKNKLEFKAPSV